jgi:CubicO group peptidase (beta-lactamase class C family)
MLMQKAVRERIFPGGVLLISDQNTLHFFEAYGQTSFVTGDRVKKTTIFDLASLTKPLATTLAVMKLVERRKVNLTDTLESLLPTFVQSEASRVSVRSLLTHQSGFPAYRPYYKKLQHLPLQCRRKALRNMLVREPLVFPVGKKPVYSDLGFMILAWIVEVISGQRLDHFIESEIYGPLRLKDLFFPGVDNSLKPDRFAATEKCPWRRMLLQGIVHDENAFVVGGIEGHAGLFGTAEAVYHLLCELLKAYHGFPDQRILPGRVVDCFLKYRLDAQRALGFDTPSFPQSSCGQYFSNATVGHLGFTGTSFWMDPVKNVIVILLTNRVHPDRNNVQIKIFRPVLHDTVMQALGLATRSC